MIGFLGYNFCADTNALDPVPTDVSKLQIVQVENGIYDHINITSDVTGTYPSVPPTGWDFKTILDCNFDGNISGGSSDNISKDVTSIRIKRREKGTYAWITIKEIPVASAEDLNFAFTDNLNLNNTLYEYAYVPVTQGVEGGYTVEEIESEFRGVFICDTETIYKFYYGVSYGDTDRVQQVGVYTPYGRQYPVVISNGLLSYETGSVQGQVLPESFDKDRQMDRAANVAERGILFDFLTNHKAKIIKDWNGNSWLCCITGNPSVSYSRGSGMGMMTAKADWTQIGQADNAGDLYAAGLIPQRGVIGMAWNISQDDYNVLKQNNITKYIRLEMLDFEYKVVDEISGNLISMSVNIDAESDLRRSCSCTLVVNDSSFNVEAGSKIWLDRYIRPYVGYVNNWTGQTQWYNQGIYLINAPSWQYDAQTHALSFAGLDLASKLTGMRNGYLEGIPTSIPANSNVRQAMIALLELGGFTKYLISECMDVDGNVVNVPNEIEIPQGGTIWDGISQLRDIIPRYEAFFDINGTFIYQPIPTGSGSPVLVDDDLLGRLVISEQVNNNFEDVKNVVEVYGQSLDVSQYATDVTWDSPNIKFKVGSDLTNTTLTGLTTPDAAMDVASGIHLYYIISPSQYSVRLTDYHTGKAVTHLEPNTSYVLYGTQLYSSLQPSAIAKDTNPDSPFYVNGPVAPIRIVLYGGEYDNITSDALAKERANYELWKRTRLQDSITLTAIPNPWLDVNVLISHATRGGLTVNQYIIKSISTDYGDGGTQTINAITYYPLYPDI